MASNLEKIKALRAELEKQYSDSIELFPDFTTIKEVPVIKSPSAILNAIMGVGGLPRGRVTEISGPFGSGKTTIGTEITAYGQQLEPGFTALFVDYEHAWDAIYARKLGTNLAPDRLIYCQPQYFEQGADIALVCAERGLVDLIVIDSAAAMTPWAEMTGKMDAEGGSQKGTQANLMARFLERITKKISHGRKPALLILNQTRANIVIGGRPQKNAPKEVPAGGNALKFYSTIRIELEITMSEGAEARNPRETTDQLYTQNRIRATCIKNKLAPPFMRGQFVIEYGKGINNLVSIAELAEAKLGIMHGAGYYNHKGRTAETNVTCRGRDAFQARLKESPALLAEIEELTLAAIKQETARALGLDTIKTQGTAKEVQERGTITLKDEAPGEERPATTRLELDPGPDLGPNPGTGLPTEEAF